MSNTLVRKGLELLGYEKLSKQGSYLTGIYIDYEFLFWLCIAVHLSFRREEKAEAREIQRRFGSDSGKTQSAIEKRPNW